MPASFLPCRKKGFRRRNLNSLPYPNFGLKDNELPVICRCTYDGEEFFVINRLDMLTLHQNGVFGVSNKTGRGPTRFVDNDRSFNFFTPNSEFKLNPDSVVEATNGANCDVSKVPADDKIGVEITNGNYNSSPVDNCSVQDPEKLNFVQQNEPESIEKLILSPEEVMFLTFGVGCLSIQNIKGENLSFDDVWRICVEKNSEFPIFYAVYHYFRSKNWVPKEGVKYGGDYVLYQEGPEVNHSNFVVQILGIPSRSIPTWNALHSWSRVAINSKKVLLLCHISLPKDFKSDNPRCIFSINIKETLINRWKPTCSTE